MHQLGSVAPNLVLTAEYATPGDLQRDGLSRHTIRTMVAGGALIRLRNGRFVGADAPPALLPPGRLGGRLDCVSLLRALGVFVRQPDDRPHVQFDRGASRLPPHAHVRPHWRRTRSPRRRLASDLIEALAQACRCRRPRGGIATLESAWHLGFVDEVGVAEVFSLLPRRHRGLRPLLDRRAESGPETLMRLLLRALGCDVGVQVQIDGVGRVDLLVDGWLIVECDSRAFHGGWEQQRNDRRRDLAAAARGYTTVRPLAEDILWHPEAVLHTMKEILLHRVAAPALQNSSDVPRRGRKVA